jgi:hypothetical protein
MALKKEEMGNIRLPIPQNYDTFEEYLKALKDWIGTDDLPKERVELIHFFFLWEKRLYIIRAKNMLKAGD